MIDSFKRDKYKILFIKPSVSHVNLAKDIPLGFLCLSAYVKQQLKEKVSVGLIDLRIFKNKKTSLSDKINSFKPDLIGISLMSFERDFLDEYLPAIKSLAPEAVIVIGGPYTTSDYMDALERFPVDFVVIGEGEKSFTNLIIELLNNKEWHKVKGIAFKDNDRIVVNEKEEYIQNLDDLPLPDYDLIRIADYWGFHAQMNGVLADTKYIHVMTSRACPFKCTYCHRYFGNKFRSRSPENVFAEIKLLYYHYGVREFHFIDDIFNFDRSRMHRILDYIITSGMKIYIAFPNGLRCDLLNFDDLAKLKSAGTYMMAVPIETVSSRTQKIIRKNHSLDRITKTITNCNKLGIVTRGFFMLGFPTETLADIRETISFALNSSLDMISIWTVVPFKNTELFYMIKDMGFNEDIEFFSYRPEQSYYQQTTGINLNRMIKFTAIKFYSPLRIFKLVRKLPNCTHFFIAHFSMKSRIIIYNAIAAVRLMLF